MRRPTWSFIKSALWGLSLFGLPATLALAKDATDYPKHEWPTFGGDYAQTRFSQLDQINRDNVHRLEVKWTFSTGLSPILFNFFSPVPIVVGRVMYFSDPGNFGDNQQRVFAVDAKTGAEIWRREIALGDVAEQRGLVNVRSTRGVAFGRGKIYVPTADAKLWALDARSGQPVDDFGDRQCAGFWCVRVADSLAGFYLTVPPVFVPKRLVPSGGPASGHNLLLIGIAGAENESRGFMSAYDADTGDLLWRFFTVPEPDQYGGHTWPVRAKAPFDNPFDRGGAAAWMTPSYDEESGIVIFGTGNAGPNFDGTHRKGANLFAASVVALDVRSGERVWHFQEVHHDLWDYDQANPPVLFDVKHNGKLVKAVGAAGKTGWFYVFDRKTGEPLFPCPERPVPHKSDVVAPDGKKEVIWRTQPFCESDPFVPQGDRTHLGLHVAPIFTPPGLPTPGVEGPLLFPNLPLPPVPVHDQLVEPGVLGGADWGPTSFNPHLGLAYIGGNVLPMRLTSIPEKAPNPGGRTAGVTSTGGWWSFTNDDLIGGTGTFTAMDVATGKIRWQVQTQEPAYPGSCATAGNLVFIGELDDNPKVPLVPLSYFSAYDAETGERLFRFRIPNDVPIVAPCVTYSVDGEQFIAVAAGGAITVNYPTHGDTLYVFGLPKQRGKEQDD